jgi:hypothetical protein
VVPFRFPVKIVAPARPAQAGVHLAGCVGTRRNGLFNGDQRGGSSSPSRTAAKHSGGTNPA